jgi:succinylglutamate desuccinylase
MSFDLTFTINEAAAAKMRQTEFPQMLRDIVDSGAEEIELCIDAHTALRIAQAVEMLTLMESM